MAILVCVGRDGHRSELQVRMSGTVMEALRDANMAVPAVCGGNAACGTCHIYVARGWLPFLGQQSDDERLLLEGEARDPRPESRLSCQIPLTEALDGLEVTLAPLP